LNQLCYYDHVYFNQKTENFKVSKRGVTEPGYVKVNLLRQYWKSSTEFDAYLLTLFSLPHEVIKTQEHHQIWKSFEPKFMSTFELYNYHEFFESVMYRACRDMISQCVTVVEWKHIFGFVFDEDGPLSLEREIKIFMKVSEMLKSRYPLFRMKVIASGLKVMGKAHAQ
jgi:hypothetical protein